MIGTPWALPGPVQRGFQPLGSPGRDLRSLLTLGYFSLAGKVPKSALKGALAPLRIPSVGEGRLR